MDLIEYCHNMFSRKSQISSFLKSIPAPTAEIANEFIGLSSFAIKEKFDKSAVFEDKNLDEKHMEVRATDATVACEFDENYICTVAYRFSDDDVD